MNDTRMKKQIGLVLLFVAPLVLMNCAGAASAGKERGATYRTSLGSLPSNDMKRIVNEAVMMRYAFNASRTVDTPEDYLLETDWRESAALPDEQAMGYGFNRTRIIISARPANRMGGALGSYRVSFRAESQVRRIDSNIWEDASMSEQRYAYVKEIVDYMKDEFRSTFRNQ